MPQLELSWFFINFLLSWSLIIAVSSLVINNKWVNNNENVNENETNNNPTNNWIW